MVEESPIQVERASKRVRVYLGGVAVVDSKQPLLVWEKRYFPTYYFPTPDIRMDLLTTSRAPSKRKGAVVYDVSAGDKMAPAAAYSYPDSEVLKDLVAFVWPAMDHWFEEDEEVYVHPRDPHKRVDTLRSSRHVEVWLNGLKVADSVRPTLLFETGLPTRYYLPRTDVRMDLLEHTDNRTECPYKGVAEYWSVTAGDRVFKDVVWSYPFPTLESQKIAGLLSFYNEKVDVTVDGVPQERPRSPFS